MEFQREGIDTVHAAQAILKAKRKFANLERLNLGDFPHIKHLMAQVSTGTDDFDDSDQEFEYKGLELKGLHRELQSIERKKELELALVQQYFLDRLENNHSEYFEALSQVLNCKGIIILYR